uniref:Uncharacterized protein n=1 Tax=Poecilia mexicana TaxID=48701 RepID=A0A3B3X5I1_9TELE
MELQLDPTAEGVFLILPPHPFSMVLADCGSGLELANHTGDQMSAERNSRTAKTLNHVALGLGLGSFVLGIIYVVVVVVVASAHYVQLIKSF